MCSETRENVRVRPCTVWKVFWVSEQRLRVESFLSRLAQQQKWFAHNFVFLFCQNSGSCWFPSTDEFLLVEHCQVGVWNQNSLLKHNPFANRNHKNWVLYSRRGNPHKTRFFHHVTEQASLTSLVNSLSQLMNISIPTCVKRIEKASHWNGAGFTAASNTNEHQFQWFHHQKASFPFRFCSHVSETNVSALNILFHRGKSECTSFIQIVWSKELFVQRSIFVSAMCRVRRNEQRQYLVSVPNRMMRRLMKTKIFLLVA